MPTLIEHEGVRYIVSEEALPGYPAAVVLAELPRFPDEYEFADPVSGAITLDTARKADGEAGERHIELAHLRKSIEAAIIASGVRLTEGLLVAEAALRGFTLDQMAAMVLAEAATDTQAELDRIAAKNDLAIELTAV